MFALSKSDRLGGISATGGTHTKKRNLECNEQAYLQQKPGCWPQTEPCGSQTIRVVFDDEQTDASTSCLRIDGHVTMGVVPERPTPHVRCQNKKVTGQRELEGGTTMCDVQGSDFCKMQSEGCHWQGCKGDSGETTSMCGIHLEMRSK